MMKITGIEIGVTFILLPLLWFSMASLFVGCSTFSHDAETKLIIDCKSCDVTLDVYKGKNEFIYKQALPN